MPSSRFWGYYDFLIEYNKSPEEAMKEAKDQALKDADWDDEVKALREELSNGK